MRSDFDEFDDFTQNQEKPARSGLSLSLVVLTIALVGFLALAWYAYHSGDGDRSDGSMIVIQAEDTPIKVAPGDPGGESFPNQDKTIYEAIAPGDAGGGKKVETLLAAPEEPMMAEETQTKTWVNDKLKKPDTAEAEINAQLTKEPIAAKETIVAKEPIAAKEMAAPDALPSAAPVEAPVAPVVAVPELTQKDVPPPVVVMPAPAPTPAPAPVAATAPAAAGIFKIQLGAFKSQGEAENYWKKARATHAAILENSSPVIVRAELPNGTFYRLRASGFATAEAAKTACTALTAKGQACFFAGK